MTRSSGQHSSPPPVPFQEAFDAATAAGTELHLLTGNGASLALWPGFAYQSLIAKMIDLGLDPQLISDLAVSGITDLESILRELTPEHWHAIDDPLGQGRANPLTFFPNVIADTHPHISSEICQHALVAGGRFFHRFSSISTTNYDLLLYWAQMETIGDYDRNNRLGDGFQPYRGGNPLLTDRLIFNRRTARHRIVRYLHGAFHLSTADGNTIKYQYTSKRGAIMQQARVAILSGYLPLIVSGGDSAAKLRLINRDEYLHWAYLGFGQISGALFIHGFGFNETDRHIADAISNNLELSHLYVGVFSGASDSERDTLRRAVSQLQDERASTASPLSVSFYRSETAPLWDPGRDAAVAERDDPTCDRCQEAGCVMDAHGLR